MENLVPWVYREKPIKVAIIGDIILDEYLEGSVNRISPEAPVPIHHVKRCNDVAGGAANVARNIKLAGGEPLLFSVWGNDDTAARLNAILTADGIATHWIRKVFDRPTVKKTRVSANNQQIVRIDWEKVHPIADEDQDAILKVLSEEEFDVMLISDYGKGALPVRFIANLLELALKRSIPSLVDPKGKDYSRYLHATVVTPNRNEACDALNLDSLDAWTGEELGRKLQRTYGLANVLVTLGKDGMILVPDESGKFGAAPIAIPAERREVFDVSGAGDTVIALLALGIASGSSPEIAVRVANSGAGVVIEKWGTHPIHINELIEALEHDKRLGKSLGKSNKIKSQASIPGALANRRVGNKVVFTNGCFDILHAGHVSYLEAARALGDILVVGVNSDRSITSIKGPSRPIIPLAHRQMVLAALSCVDFVIPFEEETPEHLIKAVRPDILVKGADWKVDDIVGADFVKGAGGSVRTIELVPGISTTDIIEKIKIQLEQDRVK